MLSDSTRDRCPSEASAHWRSTLGSSETIRSANRSALTSSNSEWFRWKWPPADVRRIPQGAPVFGEASLAGCGPGKLLSPERRRCAVERAEHEYGMSERHACWLLGQWRGTQRYEPVHRLDEDELTQAIIALAANYGRYGYRRITALLRRAGWQVGKDRVQRIWRREG